MMSLTSGMHSNNSTTPTGGIAVQQQHTQEATNTLVVTESKNEVSFVSQFPPPTANSTSGTINATSITTTAPRFQNDVAYKTPGGGAVDVFESGLDGSSVGVNTAMNTPNLLCASIDMLHDSQHSNSVAGGLASSTNPLSATVTSATTPKIKRAKKMPSTEQDLSLITRFKTKLCSNMETEGTCPYRGRCMFAHGEKELRMPEQNAADDLTSEAKIEAFKAEIRERKAARDATRINSSSITAPHPAFEQHRNSIFNALPQQHHQFTQPLLQQQYDQSTLPTSTNSYYSTTNGSMNASFNLPPQHHQQHQHTSAFHAAVPPMHFHHAQQQPHWISPHQAPPSPTGGFSAPPVHNNYQPQQQQSNVAAGGSVTPTYYQHSHSSVGGGGGSGHGYNTHHLQQQMSTMAPPYNTALPPPPHPSSSFGGQQQQSRTITQQHHHQQQQLLPVQNSSLSMNHQQQHLFYSTPSTQGGPGVGGPQQHPQPQQQQQQQGYFYYNNTSASSS